MRIGVEVQWSLRNTGFAPAAVITASTDTVVDAVAVSIAIFAVTSVASFIFAAINALLVRG